MKRTVFRLLDLAFAIALSLAIANISRLRPVDVPHIRESDTVRPGAPTYDSTQRLMLRSTVAFQA